MPANDITYRIGAIDATADAFKSVVGRVGGLKAALAGIATGLSIAGVGSFVKGVIEQADQLEKTSKKIGANVVELQRLEAVAKQADVSVESLNKALERQRKFISEAAAGETAQADAINELGLSIGRLQQLDAVGQFRELSLALAKFSNEGDRVRLAAEVWGKANTDILHVAAELGDVFVDLEDKTSGIATMTEEQVKKVAEYDQAWKALSINVKAASTVFIAELLPTITEFSNWLADNLPTMAEWGRSFAQWINNMIAGARQLYADLQPLISTLSTLLKLNPTYLAAQALPGAAQSVIGAGESVIGAVGQTWGAIVDVFSGSVFTGTPDAGLE